MAKKRLQKKEKQPVPLPQESKHRKKKPLKSKPKKSNRLKSKQKKSSLLKLKPEKSRHQESRQLLLYLKFLYEMMMEFIKNDFPIILMN